MSKAPWKVSMTYRNPCARSKANRAPVTTIIDDGDLSVAHVWLEDDARLIGAAPELLATCKRLTELLAATTAICVKHLSEGEMGGNAEAVIEARAVIAKAEGK